MRFTSLLPLALAACGGRADTAPPASPSVALTTPAKSGTTVVARPKLNGGEHGLASVELDCRRKQSAQALPERDVHAPVIRGDLEWSVASDRRFSIILERITTTPEKLSLDFAPIVRADGARFDGQLDADDQGRATFDYGSREQYTDDVVMLLNMLGDLVTYALVLPLPPRQLAQGEEWIHRDKSRCKDVVCVDTTSSKLAPKRNGHLVVETVYRSDDPEFGYRSIKARSRSETKVVREIVSGNPFTETTLDRETQVEIQSPTGWSKDVVRCHATLKATPAPP